MDNRQRIIAGLILLIGLLVRLGLAPSYGYQGVEGDLIEQKQSIHRALTLGVHEVYTPNRINDPALAGGEWTGGYFINYPPVIVYLRMLPGMVYRQFAPEEFELWNSELNFYELMRTDFDSRMARSRGFTVVAKLPCIIADLLLGLGILIFVAGRAGPVTGLVAGAAYLFNPGIILDSAHWGQHDAVWAAFLVLGLWLIAKGHLTGGWIAYTLAALSKPQAGAFVLLIVLLAFTHSHWKKIPVAAAAVVGTFLLVFMPFLIHGTFIESLQAMYYSIVGGEPFVSCNANNFWWLVTGGRGYQFSDVQPLIGSLTPRSVGLFFFLAGNAFVMWRLRGRRAEMSLFCLAAAVLWMIFFSFNTELHENHLMVALPLIAFALPLDRRLWILFATLSVTFFLNEAMFDSSVRIPFLRLIGSEAADVRAITIAVSSLNMVSLGALLWLFWQQTSAGRGRSPSP